MNIWTIIQEILFNKDKCFEKYIQLYESLISKENNTK